MCRSREEEYFQTPPLAKKLKRIKFSNTIKYALFVYNTGKINIY